MILVDFDNTLIKNPYDVDLGNNLKTFLQTWKSLRTEIVNKDLIFWLRERPKAWHIFTNRPYECVEKIKEHLRELQLEPLNVYCLEGMKYEILNHFRQLGKDFFLIDNNKKYNPDLLVTPELRLPYINYKFNRWLENV